MGAVRVGLLMFHVEQGRQLVGFDWNPGDIRDEGRENPEKWKRTVSSSLWTYARTRKRSAAGARRTLRAELDVRTHAEAERLVDLLDDVSLVKMGLRLFLAGDLFGLVQWIRERRDGGIFIDLKMAGDISNTINDFVERASELGVKFITLAESRDDVFTRHSLAAGRRARGNGTFPQFLMVPLLSSLVPANLRAGGT